MTNVKLIRALESRVNEIPHSNGQFIITEQGNIYTDFPNDERVFVSGVDGKTYIPQVDNNYNLTWSESGEPPVNGINIKGPQGPKGDKGDPFTIAKIYSSIAEMNASYSTDGIALGSFVLINTGDVEDFENARLYVKGTSAYEYITDLSGAQGIQGPPGANGTSVTITNITESTTDGGNNVITFSNGQMMVIKNGSKGPQGEGADGKSAYLYAKEAGYTGTEAQFANKLAETPYKISVKEYGAKGDGSTDDTAAFKKALAENRVVYVPGGTYILSDTLIIGGNCELELAQDVVLKFTQKDKNCITLLRLASLRGNHATIFVPYDFGTDSSGNKIGTPYNFKTGEKSGNDFLSTISVINMSTVDDLANIPDRWNDGIINENDNAYAIPPFTRWDPQWKMGRYITDINICKPDSRGFHYSYGAGKDGYAYAAYGKAINLECHRNSIVSYMWGSTLSGIRIAGAFDIGIHIHNEEYYVDGADKSAWNHELRIEAVMDGPERAVVVEKTNNAFLDITHQPRTALSKDGAVTKYALQGIVLRKCKNINLTGSYVWDWYDANVLNYGTDAGKENKYLVLYGACPGVVMSDAHYNYSPTSEIRDNFYTNFSDNLETMTILQEPITRWFKPKEEDGKTLPHFSLGNDDLPLALKSDIDELFSPTKIAQFTDVLPLATGLDGSIFGGEKGYKVNVFLNGNGLEDYSSTSGYYYSTGFIPYDMSKTPEGNNNTSGGSGPLIYTKNLSFSVYDEDPSDDVGWSRIAIYDSNYNQLRSVSRDNLVANGWFVHTYEDIEYEDGSLGNKISLAYYEGIKEAAYIRFTFTKHHFNTLNNPIISINKPITYTTLGALKEGIAVTDKNIESEKLNALYERFGSITTDVTESIGKLEQKVDEKLENLSIGPSQTNFIKTGENWEEQEPKFNLANVEYKENTYYNDSADAKDKVPTEKTFSGTLLIKPIYDDKFNPALGSTLRIRGIDFNDTSYSKSRVYVIWKSEGTVVDVYNMGSKISESLQGTSPNKDFSYIWDEATKTLEITFTHTGYRDPTQYWNYVFSGKLADGYTPETVIVTLDPIEYETIIKGKPMHLSDLIYAQNVFLTSPSGNIFKLVVSDDGLLTTTAFTE